MSTEQETEAGPETAVANSRSLVLRAAGLVGVAVLLSRLVGLAREIVIRANLGIITVPAEAFEIASRFPETIFLIIAGGRLARPLFLPLPPTLSRMTVLVAGGCSPMSSIC
jgi:hypothetical protein